MVSITEIPAKQYEVNGKRLYLRKDGKWITIDESLTTAERKAFDRHINSVTNER
jgi:hypothetical protein